MWQLLRGNSTGFKFKREVPIGPYRMDFYCAEARVCVELDGEQHRADRDEVRDRYIEALGIVTFRIANLDHFYLDRSKPWPDHMRRLVELCEERAGRPAWPAGE